MWVAPEARGRGLGRELVDAVADWARELQLSRLVLDVNPALEPAVRLYESAGFVRTGAAQTIRPGFDAVEMAREP